MKKPSVTELIDLLNKPALISWANKQGLNGVDISKSRKEKMSRGSKMHESIESFFKDGEILENELHQFNLSNFASDKKMIGCEVDIETDYFKGRIDGIFERDGKILIVDYKASAKKVYFDNKLQLIAYSMAYPCDEFAIVSTPHFIEYKFEPEDREPYIKILKNLSEIYYAKAEIDE